jgi:TrmH family RNA methyltransferase
MISIILVEPETPGNIGAIARAMKNFGFDDLILVNPRCNHLSKEALDRSTHARSILKKAKIKDKRYLQKYHTLIATTSILGNDYNIPRNPITPEQLSEKLSNTKKNIGIVFGREGNGLTNKEIEMCDFSVTIPTSEKYPVMNLSHSAAIILYEISKRQHMSRISSKIPLAAKKEKDVIMQYFDKLFDQIEFSTKEKKTTQKIVWKRIIGKSFLTKREAFAVIGFLRKLLKR